MMFLTDDELAELTGRRRPAHQIRWLVEYKIRFILNAVGRPKVLVQELEGKLLSDESRKRLSKRAQPNFDSLNR